MIIFYKIAFALTALGAFAVVVAIWLRKPEGRTRLDSFFSLLAASLVVWSIGRYGLLATESSDAAIFWVHFLYAGSVFVYVLFLHTILIFLNLESRHKVMLGFFYANAFLLFILNGVDFAIGSNYFIEGVTPKLAFDFYEVPGTFHWLHFINYLVVVPYSFILLLRSIKHEKGERLRQLKFIILASVFGFLGGYASVPLVFDVEVEPFLSILIPFHLLALVYAITKHHLFNVKVIATELLTFAIWVFISTRILVADSPQERLINSGLLAFAVLFGILLIRSVYKEVEQRERIEKLAKELEKTNTALESANERLKELDQLKSEFVSLATHQIRGPIAAIKGYASMLLEGDYGEVPEVCRKPVETILQSSSSLAGIVQDYLDVSRIEQGRMKYEISDFDVSKLVADVAAEFKSSIERKGLVLSLEIEPNIFVRADTGKLKQVFENLIDNAVKYTAERSISVSLYLSKVERKVIFAVKDTGVGIAQETLPHLFKKFSRASDASRANLKGTGLGLYVARQLVEAQGGTIRAESDGEGKGATFVVELPLKM